MPYSLGGSSGRKDPAGKYIDGKATARKPDLGAVRATIEFTREIGR